jgi:hypothetical protein
MAPFEALYGRRCRTPLNWSQAGEREIFGPDLVLEVEEKVRVIKKNLEAAQDRKRAIMTRGGSLCSLKWEIMFILRCHPPKVFRDLESRAS